MKSKKDELIESVTRIVSGNLKSRSEFNEGTPVTPQSIASSADIIFKAISGVIIKESMKLGLKGPNDPNFATEIKDYLFDSVMPKVNQRVHDSESALNAANTRNKTTQSQLDEVVGALIEKQVVTSIVTSPNIAELISDNANLANAAQQSKGTEKKGRLSFSGKPKSRPGSTSIAPSRDASTTVSPVGTPQGTPSTTRKVKESLVKSVLTSKTDPSSTATTQARGSQTGWIRGQPPKSPSTSQRASGVVPALDLNAVQNQAAKISTTTQPADNQAVVKAHDANASQPEPTEPLKTSREVNEKVDSIVDDLFADSPRPGDPQPNTPEASPPPSPQQQRVRPAPPPKPDHLKSSASKSAASSQPSSQVVERKRPLPPPKPADNAPVNRQSTSPERKRTTNVGPENQPNVASLLGQSKNAGAPASDPTKSRASGSVKSAAPLPGAKTVAAYKDEAFLAKVRETVAKTDAGRKAPTTEGLAKK